MACQHDRRGYIRPRGDRLAEPEREAFVQAVQRADRVLISSVSVVEARMVVHGRRGQRAAALVDDMNTG